MYMVYIYIYIYIYINVHIYINYVYICIYIYVYIAYLLSRVSWAVCLLYRVSCVYSSLILVSIEQMEGGVGG